MGKSSLWVRTKGRLEAENFVCVGFELTIIGTGSRDEWYYSFARCLQKGLQKGFSSRLKINWRGWWSEHSGLTAVGRLDTFVEEVILTSIPPEKKVVIFIDEIDLVRNLGSREDRFTDDFFVWIRACYNKRSDNPDYNRLTFCLLGVATPSDLIEDKTVTPFNIGQAIALKGFMASEVEPLIRGLAGKVDNPSAVMTQVLYWTGGQPFLTQRLCYLIVNRSQRIMAGKETELVAQVVQSFIIDNWEAQDEQEHLKTIRNRLLNNEQRAGYLLELYRQVLQQSEIEARESSEERELQLSGLVVKEGGKLRVYNPIYAAVFDELWIDTTFKKLRPYAENFRAWIASGKTEDSLLLRGNTLTESEKWAKDNNFFSGEDQEFLVASRIQEKKEEIAKEEQESQLERERQDKEAAEERAKKAEEAKQILTAANNEAQKRLQQAITEGEEKRKQIMIAGGIILAAAVIVALFFSWKAIEQKAETEKQIEIAENAKNEAKLASEKVGLLEQELTQKQAKLTEVEQNAVEKQKEADHAEQAAKDANQKAKNAEELAQKAQENLTTTRVEKEKLSKEAIRLRQEASRLENLAKQAEENATRAKISENQAIKLRNEAVQAESMARQAESELKVSLGKTNEALKAIKDISKLASKFRNEGKIEVSNELSTRATSSVLIEDYELKRIWLLAAKAQANQSLGNLDKQELQNFNQSLDSLKHISSKDDPGIFNQVKAFVYLIAGQLNKDKKEDYRMAYNALQASELNLYDDKTDTDILTETDTDILTEKDVDNIYYQLIKAANINITTEPVTDEVAQHFRNHLYSGLEFLLKNDRLKEANQKTAEILLYIDGRKEEGYFTSLEYFPCDSLREIDSRWDNYPKRKGYFGFRVQKEIWHRNGSPKSERDDSRINGLPEQLEKFYREVGWLGEDGFLVEWDKEEGQYTTRGNLPRLNHPDLWSYLQGGGWEDGLLGGASPGNGMSVMVSDKARVEWMSIHYSGLLQRLATCGM